MSKNYENDAVPGVGRNRINRITFANGEGAISNNNGRKGQSNDSLGELDSRTPVKRASQGGPRTGYDGTTKRGTFHPEVEVAYESLPNYPVTTLGSSLAAWWGKGDRWQDRAKKIPANNAGEVVRVWGDKGPSGTLDLIGDGAGADAVSGIGFILNSDESMGKTNDTDYNGGMWNNGLWGIDMNQVIGFFVVSNVGPADGGIMSVADASSNNGWTLYGTTPDPTSYSPISAYVSGFTATYSYNGFDANVRYAKDNKQIAYYQLSQTRSEQSFWLNGKKFTPNTSGMPLGKGDAGLDDIIIGNAVPSGTIYLYGPAEFSEIIMTTGVLSDETIVEINNWLAAQWNMPIQPSGG